MDALLVILVRWVALALALWIVLFANSLLELVGEDSQWLSAIVAVGTAVLAVVELSVYFLLRKIGFFFRFVGMGHWEISYFNPRLTPALEGPVKLEVLFFRWDSFRVRFKRALVELNLAHVRMRLDLPEQNDLLESGSASISLAQAPDSPPEVARETAVPAVPLHPTATDIEIDAPQSQLICNKWVSNFLQRQIAAAIDGLVNVCIHSIIFVTKYVCFHFKGLSVQKGTSVYLDITNVRLLSLPTGLFGALLDFSIDRVSLRETKLDLNVELKQGFHFHGNLVPQVRTFFKSRKLSILDDLNVEVVIPGATASMGSFRLQAQEMDGQVCLGLSSTGTTSNSRPGDQTSTESIRRKRSLTFCQIEPRPLLQYWSMSGTLRSFSLVQTSITDPDDHSGMIVTASRVSMFSEARKENLGFIIHEIGIREVQAGTLKGLERCSSSLFSLLSSNRSDGLGPHLSCLAKDSAEMALVASQLTIAAERGNDGFVIDCRSGGIGVGCEPKGTSQRLAKLVSDITQIKQNHRKNPKKARSQPTAKVRKPSRSFSYQPATTRVNLQFAPIAVCITSTVPLGEAGVSAVVLSLENTNGSQIKLIDQRVVRLSMVASEMRLTRLNYSEASTEVQIEKTCLTKFPDKDFVAEFCRIDARWCPDLEDSTLAMLLAFKPIVRALKTPVQPQKKPTERAQNKTRFSIKDCKFLARFPDGAAAGATINSLGPFRLGDERWEGQGLLHTVQYTSFAYVNSFSLGNPIRSFDKNAISRMLDIQLDGIRVLLEASFHYGNRWADFQLRLKGYLADKKARAALAGEEKRSKAMVDLRIKARDVKVFLEDSPLNEFLTIFLPLMQDEAQQRVLRWDLFRKQYANLETKLVPERTQDLWRAFLRQNSEIYCSRAQALRRAHTGFETGPGLKTLRGAPLATLTVNELSINMYREGAMLNDNGTQEYMRLLAKLDASDPDNAPPERLDPKAWVSNGFRRLECHFNWTQLHLRDFPKSSFNVKDLKCAGIAGMAQQKTAKPYFLKTSVALGRHRIAEITKPLASTKMSFDLDLSARSLHSVWNGAYLPAFMDFTRRASSFGGDGKDMSPKMPWFDTLRMAMHGRVSLRVQHLVGLLDSTNSPYAAMTNPVELSASNVVFGVDRQVIYQETPVHISLEDVRFKPQSLSQTRFRSTARFSSVEILHTMTYKCANGAPSMHHVHPFPRPDSRTEDGVIIRRVTILPLIPLTVPWRSPTYVDDWDTYRDFRTNTYDFSIRVHVSHGDKQSVLYSDGISNLRTVIRRLVKMPIQCRHAPKPLSRFDTKPSREGLGSLMASISIDVTATHLKVLAWNNLVQKDGIYLNVQTVVFSQKKAREAGHLERELIARHVSVGGLSADIYTGETDIGQDENGKGFLLEAGDIAFITDPKARNSNPKSGFGRQKKSPFHAFGGIKDYRRGEEVEAMIYENRLVITGIKVFWSPERYVSVFEWPRAVKEKNFVWSMKKLADAKVRVRKERDKVNRMGAGTRRRRVDEARGSLMHILGSDPSEQTKDRTPGPEIDEFAEDTSALAKPSAVFDLELHGAQFLFASEETRGVVILSSKYCSLGVISRVKDDQGDEAGQVAREVRFHFNQSQIYTLTPNNSQFRKFQHGYCWVPPEAEGRTDPNISVLPFHQMTATPFTLNGVHVAFYVEESDSVSARPSALLINTSALEFNSDGHQFRAFVDVITKVLMKRHPLNQGNQQELASLKYRMQLAGVRRPMISELQAHAIKLRTIVRLFDYSIDTAQAHFVKDLLSATDSNTLDHDGLFERIRGSRNAHMAKLNAVNIYLRKEHKVDAELYPTMFLSYSFDRVRWALFEDRQSSPAVEVHLEDLVFRHIFYVGRIQHQEFTFAGVEIRNMVAGERKILRPDRSEEAAAGNSLIKSSDDSVVLFQWYAMQMERVGGISVYENLTIHIAPLEICITKRLIDSIRGFLFPGPDDGAEAAKPKKSWRSRKVGLAVSTIFRREGSEPRYARTTDQQVSDMAARGRSTVFFKYIYISEFRLNASFKGREDGRHKMWDITNLFLSAPSYMYHSKIWTWKDFFDQVKRDVIMTVLRRGVSNLARSKLNLKQKLDPALGREIWHHYRNLFHSSDESSSDKASEVSEHPELDELPAGPGIDGTLLPLEPGARRAACLELLYGVTGADLISSHFLLASDSTGDVNRLGDRDDGDTTLSLRDAGSTSTLVNR